MTLRPPERAVLDVLIAANGRVVSREHLTRRAGLNVVGPRRADSIVVELRRVLGPDAIHTVRGRGWRLDRAVDVDARLQTSP
jgi:DNA-binding response OmpR family regulator